MVMYAARVCLLLGILLVGLMQQHSFSGQRDGEHDIYIASATGKPSPPSKTEAIPGLLQNFCWDEFAWSPGNASDLTTFEDELDEHNKRSVKSGRKRSHHDIEDDKETSPSKRYTCRFCEAKFHKSQALGGHMNRHKQERQRESWSKACKLLQQGTPSAILPGHHTLSSHSRFGSYHMQGSNIPSQFGILGVTAHKNNMKYAGGRSPPFTEAIDHPYDGRENINVRSQISTMPNDAACSYSNAEYSSASSRSVPAMDTLEESSDAWTIASPRPSMHMPFMHQPSLLERLSTQRPYLFNGATGIDPASLHMNLTRDFPHVRYLDQCSSLSAPRETAPQRSMPGYRDVSQLPQTRISQNVLPSIASMQPGIFHAEADYRGPAYALPSEGMREPTSLGIAHAEVGCRGYLCPIERVRDATSLAGHNASLSCDDSQGLRLRSLPLQASTRAAPLDTGQERMLFGGPSLAMGSGTHTDARLLTTWTSAEHEGGLKKDSSN